MTYKELPVYRAARGRYAAWSKVSKADSDALLRRVMEGAHEYD